MNTYEKKGRGLDTLAWILGSILHNFHLQPPVAGAVKLAKEHSLPAPQHQLAALYMNDLTRPHKHGLYMRVRVALAVPVRPRCGDQPVQSAFDVTGHMRVRAFIDGDRRRGVRHIQIADSLG